MRNILFIILGVFVLVPWSSGYCDDSKTIGISATPEQPTLVSPESEQIIKEEWSIINTSKKWPQYSPSSVSVDEKVLEEKPLMASDRALKADEKANELQTKLPSVSDLPKEFDQVISLKGKMKLFEAVKHLAWALNRNLILGPGVQDSDIDVSLDNVEEWRSLSSVLYPLGYGFKINEAGDLIILAQETRMFRVNLPPISQDLDSLTTNETLSGDNSNGSNSGSSNTNNSSNNQSNNQNEAKTMVGTKVVVENKAESLDFWKDINENLKALLQPTDKYTLNKIAGEVVVSASPASLDKVSAYFSELNKRISQQILVDVKVVEVTLNKDYSSGIDWSFLANKGKINIATNFASQNFTSGSFATLAGSSATGAGTVVDGVSVLLRALDNFGKTEVLSQPRVMLLNNTVANIQVGNSKSYVDSYTTTQTSTGTTVAATTNSVQGGVNLQIIANIVGDDVYLNVTPVVSTIDQIRSINLGSSGIIEAPDTSSKSISSTVKVKEGNTAIIGGLITRNNQVTTSGIPLLDKLPFGIGKNLFTYQTKNNDRTELVIFITPKRG